ncbi:MAG: hypothetical protein ACRDA4_05330, partial [Filifactoraceae bacterium]
MKGKKLKSGLVSLLMVLVCILTIIPFDILAKEDVYLEKEKDGVAEIQENKKENLIENSVGGGIATEKDIVNEMIVDKATTYSTEDGGNVKLRNLSPVPPSDWAFDESSRYLNNLIVKYNGRGTDTNGDGYISISEANARRHDINLRGEAGVFEEGESTLNGIEHFTLVKNIVLTNINLTGSIPEDIGNLKNLEIMAFDYGNLSGSIPEGIGNLENIKHIRISGNNVSGSIPDTIGNLSNLEFLDLQNNQLSGDIPESIGKLEAVKRINLDGNYLQGNIPQSIGNLKNLTSFRANDNALRGNIPESIGYLSNLEELYLSQNHLSGSIPKTIGSLEKLKILSLYSNHLSGEIPESIGNLVNLLNLRLAYNFLSGNIPESIENLVNLSNMDIMENRLEGEIPSGLSKISTLKSLKIYGNRFISIPKEIYETIKAIGIKPIYSGFQTNETTLNELTVVDKDYEFTGIPAYEQFPQYGETFRYTLKVGDSVLKRITPIIEGGKVK